LARPHPGCLIIAVCANLLTFLTTFWDKDDDAPKLPETDDIVKGRHADRGGAVIHPNFLPQQAA